MSMPNFLVIGAAKCGTSALCDYLAQHPQVYLCPSKEPNFFIAEGRSEIPFRGPRDREVLTKQDGWVSTLDRYRRLFAGVTSERAIGEGSTWYIYDERAPGQIHRYLPEAKLISLLRNPVDRAYSAFNMMLMDGRETTTSFAKAIAAEDERVRSNWELLWHYRRMGFYYEQLERYYQLFDARQMYVILYEDFTTRPREVMRDVLRFLDVDDDFEPDMSERSNVSMVPKHSSYQRFIVSQSPLKSAATALLPASFRQRAKEKLVYSTATKPVPLAPELRRQLVDVFRPDVLKLQKVLSRDLSHWLR